jgi:hypothetical protein
MVCAEKQRLRAEYVVAVRIFRAAVTDMRMKKGEELIQALAVSKKARVVCARSRRSLADHKSKHGC